MSHQIVPDTDSDSDVIVLTTEEALEYDRQLAVVAANLGLDAAYQAMMAQLPEPELVGAGSGETPQTQESEILENDQN